MTVIDHLRALLRSREAKLAKDRRSLDRARKGHSPAHTIASREGTVHGDEDAVHHTEADLKKAEAAPPDRVHPQLIKTIWSPNHYAGRNAPIRLIVLHVTDSDREPRDRDCIGIGDYFADPKDQVSAHLVVGSAGHTVRCVKDEDTAWHCEGFNDVAIGIEQCAHNDTLTTWRANATQLHETARNVALLAKRHGVPIVHGAVNGSSVTRPGVIQHMELGAYGGNHDDCGPGYPFDQLLALARAYHARLR